MTNPHEAIPFIGNQVRGHILTYCEAGKTDQLGGKEVTKRLQAAGAFAVAILCACTMSGMAANGASAAGVLGGSGSATSQSGFILRQRSGDAVHRSEWVSDAGSARVVIDYRPDDGAAGYEIWLNGNLVASAVDSAWGSREAREVCMSARGEEASLYVVAHTLGGGVPSALKTFRAAGAGAQWEELDEQDFADAHIVTVNDESCYLVSRIYDWQFTPEPIAGAVPNCYWQNVTLLSPRGPLPVGRRSIDSGVNLQRSLMMDTDTDGVMFWSSGASLDSARSVIANAGTYEFEANGSQAVFIYHGERGTARIVFEPMAEGCWKVSASDWTR